MRRFRLGNRVVDLDDLSVHHDNQVVSLAPLEGRLLERLLQEPEAIVPADVLLQEVWGYAAGVRTRTVTTTVHRLRGKLEADPRKPRHLHTRRGKGLQLVEVEPIARARRQQLPRFRTPWFERPHEERAVRELLEADWPIVTLVGPGGVGKSRLASRVAQGLERDVVFVSVGGLPTGALALQELRQALGVRGEGEHALEDALAARPVLVVLDEVEGLLPFVRELPERAPSGRFLLTSRADLGIPEEAVHEVRPFEGEEGRSFLRGRLAASRWGGPATDEMLDRTLAAFDGLPLALELVAARPEPLREVLASAERRGPMDAVGLQLDLERSLAPLEPEALEVLCQLAMMEAPLRDDAVARWLGPEVLPRLRDLGGRSLVTWRDGWWVLRLVREHLLRTDGPWDVRRERLDVFLTDEAHRFRQQLYRQPRQAMAAFTPLAQDVRRALQRTALGRVPDLAHALEELYVSLGQGEALRDVLRTALLRCPESPMLQLLAGVHLEADPLPHLELARGSEIPAVRHTALVYASIVAWSAMRPADVEAALVDVEDPLRRRELQVSACRLARLHRTPAALSVGALLDEVGDTFPSIRCELLVEAALLDVARRAFHVAAQRLAVAEELALEIGLHSTLGNVRHARAMVLGTVDPEEGAIGMVRVAREAAASGNRALATSMSLPAGVLFGVLGLWDEARPWLRRAYESSQVGKGVRRAARIALALQELEEGREGTAVEALLRPWKGPGGRTVELLQRVVRAELSGLSRRDAHLRLAATLRQEEPQILPMAVAAALERRWA